MFKSDWLRKATASQADVKGDFKSHLMTYKHLPNMCFYKLSH